jgi:threonine/homoserine/homoserine lactone efflux protein
MRTDRGRAAREASAVRKASVVDARLFWGGVLALAIGVVALVLALGVSLIGASTSGDRSSMAAVYLVFGVVSLAVAGLIALARHLRSFMNRDLYARRATEERQRRRP